MIQFLGLLKNPFVKIIANKTIGAITHKLEKDKIIKAKEIEATNKLDVAKVGVQLEQVKQQNNSFKDSLKFVNNKLIHINGGNNGK